ncbi:MAG TPA: hypothetical protein VIA06_15395 [Candidatus Dormibacteraeota bacterium]|jgi:tyrosinase|nr:hypothetical protein [Candidatus Dormibacteraeota bacterium]
MENRYVSAEIDLSAMPPHFSRADLVFEEVDHAGASFEARIFINNAGADRDTAKAPETGYAGSFNIFGHGGCFGDEGHCDVVPRRAYDPRRAHPLAPVQRTVIATDAVRRAMSQSAKAVLTVVPVLTGVTAKVDPEVAVLRFDRVSLVAYRSVTDA